MSLDETDKIDLVARSPDGRIAFVIVDERRWEDIPAYQSKFVAKVRAYKDFLDSPRLEKEYGTKEYEILLMTPEKPPEILQEFLNEYGVKWKEL